MRAQGAPQEARGAFLRMRGHFCASRDIFSHPGTFYAHTGAFYVHTGSEMRMTGAFYEHTKAEMRMDGRRCGPRAPKLEVSARAFLAGAFFFVKNKSPGPKVGVLGRGRSSQGRFFPSKKGPRAQKLVC